MAEAAAIEIVGHVRVKEIGLTELGKTAGLLGRGMCDNPADLRVFRIGDRERRIRALARFFEPVLRSLYARGLILGAFRDSTLAGVCAMARPGFCQATAFEKLQLAPTVILGSPIGTTARVLKWSGEWQRRDPRGPHWHLGPVAVDPLFQHQGIGSTMLSVFCACMDGFSAVAYLETDKSENVRFYQKFGFTVVGQADVLGVPNWFMSRRPRFTTVNRALTSGTGCP